jgi:hypothetical protein
MACNINKIIQILYQNKIKIANYILQGETRRDKVYEKG